LNPRYELEFVEAIHSREPVGGLTHNFYRYPARFSPLFARGAIKMLTEPGELVLDPFMGGGTALVEARVLGRQAIGSDINPLSIFITQVKTTPLSASDIAQIEAWGATLGPELNLRNEAVRDWDWIRAGYQRNIDGKSTWAIRKALELGLTAVAGLPEETQRRFARCALLRTGQWALDCRSHIPSVSEFRLQLKVNLENMIASAQEYAHAAATAETYVAEGESIRTVTLLQSVVGIDRNETVRCAPAPALILTSPPYPGVHVLYHRWQVQGRRETPAPYWIANCLDGNFASYYTFGDRQQQNLMSYFQQLQAGFESLARLADARTVLVQMVAFSDPASQLPRYLEMLKQAGWFEVSYPTISNGRDGRVWRETPNRKWYADQRGIIPASKEVVLFHRLP